MRFAEFVSAYEDIVRRARDGKLTAEDFAGVTISLTNPGTIGTVHSVPRLMAGQGAIIGVGAMEYPAEFQGASEERIAELGIGKLITLTSTYDHRIIQGAESGDFLRTIHEMLLSDGFWDEIFRELGNPYLPVRWSTDNPDSIVDKNARVMELIAAYRNRGHLMADIDPLRLDTTRFRSHPDLEMLNHGLTLWDLDRVFKVNGFAGCEYKKLRDVLGLLRDAYCRHIGVEYTHILDPEQQRGWKSASRPSTSNRLWPQQKYILSKLNAAEAFETFLQTKYVGQKRFSLEGAESVIPMMDAAIDQCAEHGLDEVVIGMPHRGRLNVLANIVGKPYSQIFSEFEGNLNPSQAHGSGDVKYHLGATGMYLQMFGDNDIQVSLTANPSHLEAVDPVLEGLVRAKQDLLDPERTTTAASELLGGADDDARRRRLRRPGRGRRDAEPGQPARLPRRRHHPLHRQQPDRVHHRAGVLPVQRVLHRRRENDRGADLPRQRRRPGSLRVGGALAVDFRQKFHKDVVIDMLCYRRRGHNEGDDPSMTNPYMYDVVDTKRGARKTYTEALIGRGDISTEGGRGRAARLPGPAGAGVQRGPRAGEARRAAQRIRGGRPDDPRRAGHRGGQIAAGPHRRRVLGHAGGFTVHPRVHPVLERRREMAYEGKIDWAFGELLALGSLVAEGKLVRLSGQDTRRGTFSQRHSVIIDRNTVRGVHAAAAAGDQQRRHPDRGQVPGLRLAAVGVRRGRLRVRLHRGQPGRTCVVGGRSSATSSTARSRSSTNSSAPVRPSGASCPTWCCCCRTGTRGRAPTTPRAASSASCSCGPRGR